MKSSSKMLGVLLAGFLALAGCGSEDAGNTSKDAGNSSEKDQVVVGISQYAPHTSLDAATEGFIKALEDEGFKEGENLKIDSQNAQGEQSNTATIAQNLVGNNVDLIFANATPSAMAVLNATSDIPIIFTSVTDPVGAGLVEAFDKPGENITGTTDNHPDATKTTINFITEEMGAKKIGVIYNSGEQNSVVQVEQVKEFAEKGGAELVEVSVSTTAEVNQAAQSLVGRVDAIYIPTDNTAVQALDSIIAVANEKDIPLFVGELDSMKAGGFAASGFEYYDIGYQSGLMAAKILKGEKKASEMPVELPNSLQLVINKKAAEEQGIEIKPEWEEIADIYEGE
ncbi:ABC transporter substrate-binding protein [Bacillus timonensis]|uniref:ABC transporter substrate-binding protein n=1 Tax=Bacillus timonensis TaxID=1033734 RepID=UPI0002893EFF|nr:ABC transporter substrate-binding protein [Bacillus timonensis]